MYAKRAANGGTVEIEELLNSTMPILYETGYEGWPYAYAGTCFPVKYKGTLFIISAKHCYCNHGISPEQTFYPRPDAPRESLAFDLKAHARHPDAKDDKHSDQVMLRVASGVHARGETDRVVALDLSEESRAILPTHRSIRDILLRGYPFAADDHRIDYDGCKIIRQAYATNACISRRRSPFTLCYYIRMLTPIPLGADPNGMSGAPVYGITSHHMPAYCGTVIYYNDITGEYLVIGPEVLVNALRKLDAEQAACNGH